MRATVLIPTWNSERYILRALNSIIANNYLDFEIIVVDNLSTDRTAEIINNLADSRIIFTSVADHGMYEALNRGIKMANGEIICWLGADDQLEPHTLKIAADTFKDPKAQWLTGNGTFLFEEGIIARRKAYELPKSVTIREIIRGNPLISPSVVFRKIFFEQIGGFDESYKLAADYDLWIRCSLKENPVVVRKSLSIFSYNGCNASSKSKIKMYHETLQILHLIHRPELNLLKLINILRTNFYIVANLIQGSR